MNELPPHFVCIVELLFLFFFGITVFEQSDVFDSLFEIRLILEEVDLAVFICEEEQIV